MKLNIKDIKIGTRLELVEEELRKATKPFVLGWLDYMRSQEEIIVTGLDGDMLEVNNSDDWGISDESIKYFKKAKDKMELKIEDLKVGDRFKLVKNLEHSHDYFYLNNIYEIAEIMVDLNSIGFKGGAGYFDVSFLKYFEKVEEQSQQYTFDDLIDVATKAFKDRAIFSVGITICAVSIKLHDKSEEVFTIADIDEGIEFIQYLYKETFVIETEEDLKRIKKDAQITMSNREILDYKDAIAIGLASYINSFILKLLKGATVTQSK